MQADRFSGMDDDVETEIHRNHRLCVCVRACVQAVNTYSHAVNIIAQTRTHLMESLCAALSGCRAAP